MDEGFSKVNLVRCLNEHILPSANNIIDNRPKQIIPPITFAVYRRISQITGLNLRKILPKVIFEKDYSDTAEYHPLKHTIYVGNISNKIIRTAILEHEGLHSLQAILNLKGTSSKNILRYIFAEFESNNTTLLGRKKREVVNSYLNKKHYKKLKIFEKEESEIAYKFDEPLSETQTFAPESSEDIISEIYDTTKNRGTFERAMLLQKKRQAIKRITNAKRFVDIYGIDGLILLLVLPPKKTDLLNIKKYEKEMEKKGYLKRTKLRNIFTREKPRITPLGLRHVRNTLLNQMQIKRRQKAFSTIDHEKWFPINVIKKFEKIRLK